MGTTLPVPVVVLSVSARDLLVGSYSTKGK